MRTGKSQKIELIKKVPLFSKLSGAGLREVASVADEIDLPAGKTLTKEGERGREFFVLLEGSADARPAAAPPAPPRPRQPCARTRRARPPATRRTRASSQRGRPPARPRRAPGRSRSAGCRKVRTARTRGR